MYLISQALQSTFFRWMPAFTATPVPATSRSGETAADQPSPMHGLPAVMLLAVSERLESPADFANFGAIDRRTRAVVAAPGQPADREAALARRLCRDLAISRGGERLLELTRRAVAFLVRPAPAGREHDGEVGDALVSALQSPAHPLLACDLRQTGELARLLLRLLDAPDMPDTVLGGYERDFLNGFRMRCLGMQTVRDRFGFDGGHHQRWDD